MQSAANDRHSRWIFAAVVGAAALVAALGARPFAGSWNDGATLAAVESLVDHQTLAIDRSIFVDPQLRRAGSPSPYGDDELLNAYGTLDKLYIDGHYYAAKPFVPLLLIAAEYWAVQKISGLRAADSPAAFIYVMTLLTSGLAYVVAVGCMHLLLRRLLGNSLQATALTASFALGSVVLVYSRQVNSHLLQLAAVAALWLALYLFAECLQQGSRPWGLALLVGGLLGVAYVFDQGVGPAVLLCVGPLVAWRTWRAGATPLLLAVGLAAAPWIIAQHWLNYEIGHSLGAANANPQHFQWPGSPWNEQTMSGLYSHESPLRFVLYAVQMLVGKKGFLLHNPVLIAAVAAWAWLLVKRRNLPEYAEVVCGLTLGLVMWGVYSVGSSNYSGGCISVRWFLPLLAPGYCAVAICLRERPEKWNEVLLLIVCSVPLGLMFWCYGPWYGRVPIAFWPILAATGLCWLALARPWRSLAAPRASRCRTDLLVR